LELFFEDPDREDERVLFEREDLPVVFCFERELELDRDFGDLRRFDPLPERLRVLLAPDPELPLLLAIIRSPPGA